MSNAGKLWSDITLMQDLEDQLTSSGSILEPTNALTRGCESYFIKKLSLPEKNFIRKKEEMEEKKMEEKVLKIT